ncbi:MAG: histidine kinase dimerization/phospho-acceptor domain-containing protein [Bacteroidota bacterium]
MYNRTGSMSWESVERLHGEELARISHALRTPLTSIIGFTSAILNDPSMEKETWTEFMRIVKSEGERLSRFVDELLYVSFGDSDGLATTDAKTTLADLVNTALRVVCAKMNQPASRFETQFNDAETLILTEREFAIRIIGNVIGTAARFSAHNSQVRITTARIDNQLCLRIQSRRRGSSLHLRVSSAKPGDVEAAGLARTKFLLAMRGGTLAVRHEENGETAVMITLPIQAVPHHE